MILKGMSRFVQGVSQYGKDTFETHWQANPDAIFTPLIESDQQARSWLDRKKQIQEANRNYRKGICFEIPLLFEKKLEREFDIIILTFCSKNTQYERALLRKRIDRTKLSRILNFQSSDTYRKKRADFKINTGIGKNHTISEIKTILNKTIYKQCVK